MAQARRRTAAVVTAAVALSSVPQPRGPLLAWRRQRCSPLPALQLAALQSGCTRSRARFLLVALCPRPLYKLSEYSSHVTKPFQARILAQEGILSIPVKENEAKPVDRLTVLPFSAMAVRGVVSTERQGPAWAAEAAAKPAVLGDRRPLGVRRRAPQPLQVRRQRRRRQPLGSRRCTALPPATPAEPRVERRCTLKLSSP